jgi:hypothetical protein
MIWKIMKPKIMKYPNALILNIYSKWITRSNKSKSLIQRVLQA